MLTNEQAAELDQWAHWISRRHNPPLPLDEDDLYQEAMFGLLRLERGDLAWTEWRNLALAVAERRIIDAIRKHRPGGRYHPTRAPASLADPLPDDSALCIADTLTDPSPSPHDQAAFAESIHRYHMADERRAEMLLLRAAGFTLREVGDRYGVTEGRVSQICKGRRRAA